MKKEIKGIYKNFLNGYIIAYEDENGLNFENCDDVEKVMDYAVDYCNRKKYKKENLRESLKNDTCFNLEGVTSVEYSSLIRKNYGENEKISSEIMDKFWDAWYDSYNINPRKKSQEKLVQENPEIDLNASGTDDNSKSSSFDSILHKNLESIRKYNESKGNYNPFQVSQDGMIDDEEEIVIENPEIDFNVPENENDENLDNYQQNLEANLDDFIIEGTASESEQNNNVEPLEANTNNEGENPPATSSGEEDLDEEDEKDKFAFFKDKMNKAGDFFKSHKKRFIVAGVAVIVGIVGINIGKGLFKLNRDNTPTKTTTREFTLNDDKDNDLNLGNENKEEKDNTKEENNTVQGEKIKEESNKETSNTAPVQIASATGSTGTSVIGESYTDNNTNSSTTVGGSDATSNDNNSNSGDSQTNQDDNTQTLPEGNGDFQDPNVTIDDVEEPTLPSDDEQTNTDPDNTYTEEETYQDGNTDTNETPSEEIDVEAPVVEEPETPPTEEVEEDIDLGDVELDDKFENIEDIENAIGDDITIGDDATLTEDQEMPTPEDNATELGYDNVYIEEVPVEQTETPSQEIDVEEQTEQIETPTEEVTEPIQEEQVIEEVPVEQTNTPSEEIIVEAPEIEVTEPVEAEVQNSTPEVVSYEEEVPVYQTNQVADAIVNAMMNGEDITYNPETGEISTTPTYDINQASLTK